MKTAAMTLPTEKASMLTSCAQANGMAWPVTAISRVATPGMSSGGRVVSRDCCRPRKPLATT
ncbi:hypothetical protein D3C87_1685350 [compost metagenome]